MANMQQYLKEYGLSHILRDILTYNADMI